MNKFSSKDRAMRRFKYEILYLLYIYYIIFKYRKKGFEIGKVFVDCNVFVYCIIFFAWIFKVPTPETFRFGFKGVEGRALAYNYALQFLFFFIFLFFKRGALWREN